MAQDEKSKVGDLTGEMEEQLAVIESLQNPQERVEKLESLISSGIHGDATLSDAKILTQHLLQESLGLVTSRALLNRMMSLIKGLVVAATQGSYKGKLDLSDLLENMLEQTTVRATAFEEQVRLYT
jgi:hypothetical protein